MRHQSFLRKTITFSHTRHAFRAKEIKRQITAVLILSLKVLIVFAYIITC